MREIASLLPDPWPALRSLRVLWLALALLGVAEVALRPRVSAPRKSSLAKLTAYGAGGAPADVLILGSSRFRPVQEADVAAGAGGGVRVANLAFNGGTFDAAWRLSDRYLEVERLRGSKLLLIGAGVMDVSDGYDNPIIAGHAWDVGDFFAHIWHEGVDSQTRTFLFESPPLRWSALAQAYYHKFLRGEIRDLALRALAMFRLATPAAQTTARGDDDDPLANAEARKATAGVAGLKDIPPPVGSIYTRNFAVGGRQTHALRALVVHARAAGVVPVLVHAPVSAWYTAGHIQGEERAYVDLMTQVGRELDVPVFLLPGDAYGLDENDWFAASGRFDGHHLTTPDAWSRFARGLGAHVVAPLLAELRAGRTPGFAASRIELRP